MGKPAIPGVAIVSLFLVLASFASGSYAADLIVGTGAKAQVHTGVGRAICRVINKADASTTCEVTEIEGRDAAEPLAVLSEVRINAIEIGIVQSDWQFYAFQGSGPVEFMDVRFDNLRSLFSLHAELFTVIARRDSGIETLDQLVGKRINIGNPGSMQRVIMDMVMQAKGWTKDSFQFVDELSDAEQILALCHNRVQAVVTIASHPVARIAKALELCDAQIVPVSGADIDKLVAKNPFLAVSEVPMNAYAKGDPSKTSFGVMVTAVTSSDLGDETAYRVVKTVFENLDSMKRLHRVLGNLSPQQMITAGLSAPPHPGAARYYREQGML